MITVRAPVAVTASPDWPSFVCIAFAAAVTIGLSGIAVYWFFTF